MPADPISAKQAEMVRHHGSADLSERADQHLERVANRHGLSSLSRHTGKYFEGAQAGPAFGVKHLAVGLQRGLRIQDSASAAPSSARLSRNDKPNAAHDDNADANHKEGATNVTIDRPNYSRARCS